MLQIAERILRKKIKTCHFTRPISRLFINLYAWYWSLCLHNYANHRRCCIENKIRPERPMAASSVASQLAITSSPLSAAVVFLSR